ncbi:MAG TPA: aminoacyl-tRNA hydrolase [Magnetospirillaceae bacterium]|nr:aminoacyl-tRNA hydrolase [Magnetospirillaceae bacterium]
MVRLYAFLGNHGRQYRDNRHNVAWHILERLSVYPDLRWERGHKGRWAPMDTPSGRVFMLTPETFMNMSGDSVAEILRLHRILPEELLVVHDELELSLGTMGLKRGGGLGGHNGLRSVRDRLSTADFLRFRIGIGRPNHGDVAGYVLSDFSGEEKVTLEAAIYPAATQILERVLGEGFEAVEEECRRVKVQ